MFLLSACAGHRQRLLADDYAKQGRLDEAHAIYQEQLRSDPTDLALRARADEVRAQAADIHFDISQQFVSQKSYLSALDEIKRAIALDPSRNVFRRALETILKKREAEESLKIGLKLAQAQKFNEAILRFERALEFDPELTGAQDEITRIKAEIDARDASIFGLSLQSNQPITLKFKKAKLSDVFSLLSKSAGINILFDKDVRPENISLSIFIKDSSFKEALNLILATQNLFMKKISDDTILIIQKNKQKIDQYEDLLIRTFYLFHANAKEVSVFLKTLLDSRHMLVNEQLNAIILRDTPEKLRLAEKIIEANDRQKAEVMFEVEILEVNRTESLKFGWNFSPSSSSIQVGESGTQTLRQLENLTKDLIFFTTPSILVDFFKQDSNAKTLANPRIRVIDGETAKINIGDRVPILLSSTTASSATGSGGGGASTTTSTEFKDTGVKLSVEPTIHLGGNVTIKLSLEINSLGDQVDIGSGVKQFRFGTRNAETVLSVHDGETIVIGGLIRDEDRKSENKVPGLGDIPYLGKLFSGMETSKVSTDVIMTLTPHIVHQLEVPDVSLQSFWSGTEKNFSTRPLFSQGSGKTISQKKEPQKIKQKAKKKVPSQARPLKTIPESRPSQNPSPPNSQQLRALGSHPPILPPPNGTLRPDVQRSQLSIQPRQATLVPQQALSLRFQLDQNAHNAVVRYQVHFDPTQLQFKRAFPLSQRPEDSRRFSASAQRQSGVIDIEWQPKVRPDRLNRPPAFTVLFQALRPGQSRVSLSTEMAVGHSAAAPFTSPYADITIR